MIQLSTVNIAIAQAGRERVTGEVYVFDTLRHVTSQLSGSA